VNHVNRTLVSTNNNQVNVDVLNRVTDEEKSDGSKTHTQEYQLHIHNIDINSISENSRVRHSQSNNEIIKLLPHATSKVFSKLIQPHNPFIAEIMQNSRRENDWYTNHNSHVIEMNDLTNRDHTNVLGSSLDIDEA
jgi:hypothetical protein